MDNERIKEAVNRSRQYWDDFAPEFHIMEGLMSQSWKCLLENMEFEKASSVLEVGAGRGECSKAILSIIQNSCSLTVTDLSPKMLEIATKANQKSTNLNVKFEVANSLDLSQFSTASFDRYLANMTLHLVPDHIQMLKEARRVLKKGGIAGFSVWGSPDKSVFMSKKDTNAHLNPFFNVGSDIQALRKTMISLGFEKVMAWPKQTIYELWDASKAVDVWAYLQEKDKVQHAEWFKNTTESFQKALDEGLPIGLESIIIIAK